ncbi:cobalt-precorrin-5B (C(1))-methyltransferase, partial [Rhizobiaceae sp. 2RAB30]
DFVGGMLKYLRSHPVRRVTIAGGVAKMTKLAQGMLDVHSKRGAADLDALAAVALEAGADAGLAERIRGANMVAEAFQIAQAESLPLGDTIAAKAWATAASVLNDPAIELAMLVFDRNGVFLGQALFAQSDGSPSHGASRPRNRR